MKTGMFETDVDVGMNGKILSREIALKIAMQYEIWLTL